MLSTVHRFSQITPLVIVHLLHNIVVLHNNTYFIETFDIEWVVKWILKNI